MGVCVRASVSCVCVSVPRVELPSCLFGDQRKHMFDMFCKSGAWRGQLHKVDIYYAAHDVMDFSCTFGGFMGKLPLYLRADNI